MRMPAAPAALLLQAFLRELGQFREMIVSGWLRFQRVHCGLSTVRHHLDRDPLCIVTLVCRSGGSSINPGVPPEACLCC